MVPGWGHECVSHTGLVNLGLTFAPNKSCWCPLELPDSDAVPVRSVRIILVGQFDVHLQSIFSWEKKVEVISRTVTLPGTLFLQICLRR